MPAHSRKGYVSVFRTALTATAVVALTVFPKSASLTAPATPRVILTSASVITLPGEVDSNSPVMWDLEDGQERMFVLTSHSGIPSVSRGAELNHLGAPTPITLTPHPGYGVWMEAIV